MKETVYISGAITGVKNYKELFAEASCKLQQLGYEVVNPCYIECDKFDYADYIICDLMALKKCTYIYFLDNAVYSDGAFIEKLVANHLGIEVLTEDKLYELSKQVL